MNTLKQDDMGNAPTTLLTVSEVAQYLKLSNASVYAMIRQGTLLAHRLGGRKGAIRVRPEDLRACLAAAEQPPIASKPKPKAPRVKLRHIRLHDK